MAARVEHGLGFEVSSIAVVASFEVSIVNLHQKCN